MCRLGTGDRAESGPMTSCVAGGAGGWLLACTSISVGSRPVVCRYTAEGISPNPNIIMGVSCGSLLTSYTHVAAKALAGFWALEGTGQEEAGRDLGSWCLGI